MKTTMKISGVAGTILLGIAAIFKIQHWPLAGVMMTLGALILAFVFLPSALSVLWKETHNRKRLFLYISSFFTGMFFILGTIFKIQHWPLAGTMLSLAVLFCIMFFIPALLASSFADHERKEKRPVYLLGAAGIIFYAAGMLFKIQHWPLASILMVSGLVLLGVIALPWYTWITFKEESYISSRFIFILTGSLLIIVPGAMINLNLQGIYNNGYYPSLAQQKILYNIRYNSNLSIVNQYRDSAYSDSMIKLHSRTTGLLAAVGNIEAKMVAEAEGEPGTPALDPVQVRKSDNGTEIEYNLLSNPFLSSPVNNYLLPGCSSRLELNEALRQYKTSLSEMGPGKNIEKYNRLLDLSVFLPDDINISGEISLLSGLHSLGLLKNSIVTVESYMLISIVNN
jgi:hypothetical protein